MQHSSKTITARVIADSISPSDVRLTTMQLRYHRFIHSEFMTHRVFSRNASSSRAVPVERMIECVRTDPAIPIHWGKNQKGMQAQTELDAASIVSCKGQWLLARDKAVEIAENLVSIGAHKQLVNRILEPFAWIDVIVTATEWDNFFALRRHKDAQPEIKALADAMYVAMENSAPTELGYGEWHLPYLSLLEATYTTGIHPVQDCMELNAKISAARCARVSYMNHDGTTCDVDKDLALAERLVESKHMSPFEHQARPMEIKSWHWEDEDKRLRSNLRGWVQYRKMVER